MVRGPRDSGGESQGRGPIKFVWGPWGPWSGCSKRGRRIRRRDCVFRYDGEVMPMYQ